MITVHARRERTVQGRLIMPDGADAEGILITGLVLARQTPETYRTPAHAEDGTFTLRVPSEHAYVLGIDDLKWASDPLVGNDPASRFGQARRDHDEGLSRDRP